MAEPEIVEEWDDKAYLRYLPPHLHERYRESVSDPQLTHLSRQIALLDVRIKGLLQNLDQQVLTKEQVADDLRLEFEHMAEDDVLNLAGFIMGYLPAGFINYRTFKRYENLIDKIDSAQLDGRIRDADRAKRQLFEGIRAGRKEGDVWEDIQSAMKERTRLVQTELRRVADNQQTLPLDRVVMLAGILIESFKTSVRKYVQDREIQRYILEDADLAYRRQLGMGEHRQKD